MSNIEQLMKQWDDLNNEVTELTCLSEIISRVLYLGTDDEVVQKNIVGASSLLTRNINNMLDRYINLVEEIRVERDKK